MKTEDCGKIRKEITAFGSFSSLFPEWMKAHDSTKL